MNKIPFSGESQLGDKKHIIFTEKDNSFCLNCMPDSWPSKVCAVSVEDLKDLNKYNWSLLSGKNVYLWPVNNQNQRKNMLPVEKKLMELEEKPRIYWVHPEDLDIPDGGDIDDFIGKYSHNDKLAIEKVESVLKKSYSSDQACSIKKRINDAISGKRETIELPWMMVDKATMALTPGSVLLFCGEGGAAKSLALLQMCQYWHFTLGHDVVLYELEEDKDYHVMRALAQKSKQPKMTNDRWIKRHPDLAVKIRDENIDFINRMGSMIYESPRKEVTLLTLLDWIEEQCKAGKRIVCVDPITSAAPHKEIWLADREFMMKAKDIIVYHGASLVLVTHPKKGGGNVAGLDNLSGGACWARFSQTILWLKSIGEDKELDVLIGGGVFTEKVDRVMSVLKARNSFGGGKEFAMRLENFKLKEIGEVIKKGK